MNESNQKSSGLSVASLICGICGIVFSFVYVWIGLILGILAIIFSVNGRKKDPVGKTGLSTAGLVLGIIATVVSGIFIACALCVVGSISSIVGAM